MSPRNPTGFLDAKRKSKFFMSNHLEIVCDRTFLIKKNDLEKSIL